MKELFAVSCVKNLAKSDNFTRFLFHRYCKIILENTFPVISKANVAYTSHTERNFFFES